MWIRLLAHWPGLTNNSISIQTVFHRIIYAIVIVWKNSSVSGRCQFCLQHSSFYVRQLLIHHCNAAVRLFYWIIIYITHIWRVIGGPLGDWGTHATSWKVESALQFSQIEVIWAIWAIREAVQFQFTSLLTSRANPLLTKYHHPHPVKPWSNRRIKKFPDTQCADVGETNCIKQFFTDEKESTLCNFFLWVFHNIAVCIVFLFWSKILQTPIVSIKSSHMWLSERCCDHSTSLRVKSLLMIQKNCS